MHVYFSYKCIYILTSLYISNHNNACVEPKLLRIVFLKRMGGGGVPPFFLGVGVAKPISVTFYYVISLTFFCDV